MDKRIFDIGHARYKLNVEAFSDLLGEKLPVQECSSRLGTQATGSESCCDPELEAVFNQVMQLYREYARTGSMDLLVRLKCRLEEVSLRYRSVPLAEEVLQINSCLSYERRVPGTGGGKDHEEAD